MATSVYSPIYPQFPSNKNAITILRNNGLNMTSIEDVPKTERRRPISERPIRGNRLLHTATFSFERNPNIVGDGTTSYNSEYSGRKGGVLPAVPGRYPSQLRSHFEIGVGSQFHSDTTANSNYVDRLRQSIQTNDQFASLANMSYQRYGADMKKALAVNRYIPNSRTTIYRDEVLSKGPFSSFNPNENPHEPKFPPPQTNRNVITWKENLGATNDQPRDFRRISGNRILTANLDRSKSILC
ncbi:uncharacterized protein LOC134842480 [Symsagittifera roscoffensis]|uniref:uncharacterized protein LOC134842480 n=1 Tax=Symsagittifera roscoffensis TaxID=84072 RepID=UPI00307C6E9A